MMTLTVTMDQLQKLTLNSTVGFPTQEQIILEVGSEEISYTGITGTKITGITRGVQVLLDHHI